MTRCVVCSERGSRTIVEAVAGSPWSPPRSRGNHSQSPADAGPHGSLSPTAPAVRMVGPAVPAPAPRRAPPMTQDVPVALTRRFDGRLLLSETREIRLLMQLEYDAMDPYAVTAAFLLADDYEVKWVFARDLLGDGLHRQTGEGDVVVRPKTGGTATEIELMLSVPTGHAQVTLPAETVAAFLEASHDLVPLGAESQHLHLDATIARLLSPDEDADSPRDVSPSLIAVTTSGSSVQIQICGEIDLTNHTQLQSALSGVELDEAQTVRLDLRGLSFCGLDGCRQLVRFERDARRSGRQISIHGASPTVRKLLGLIAVADIRRFP